MKGRIVDFTADMISRKQRLTLALDGDFRGMYDNLKDKDLEITVKPWREKRSLDANAYFHVLVNKIAHKLRISDDEAKKQLVVKYGALAKDADGVTVGFKLPLSVDVDNIYPYCRCFDIRDENGITFACYLIYKRTHEMDTAEFSRLIDGAVYEAQNLGIETKTPEELALLLEDWEKKQEVKKND